MKKLANSVDPDQTALNEQSNLGQHRLFKLVCPNFKANMVISYNILIIEMYIFISTEVEPTKTEE